jgi:hypothetical protein
MKFFVPALFFLCFYWTPAFAQVESAGSLIVPLTAENRIPRLVPVGGRGLVVVREMTYDETSTTRNWEIDFYDTTLVLKWQTVIKMDYYLMVTQQTCSEKELYLVFEGVKNLKRMVQILRMNLSDRSFRIFEIKNFTPSAILKFEIFGNALVIGGINNGKPSIVLYKYEDNRPVILQGLYSNKFDLIDVDVDPQNELITVLISYKNTSGRYCIGVRSFDQEGHLIENSAIEPPAEAELMEATTRIVNNTFHIVAGTYRLMKSSWIDGMFITCLNVNGESKTEFYDFYSLYNLPGPHESGGSAILGLTNNEVLKMHWIVSGISSIKGKPVILSEAFEDEESRSIGITPQTVIYYNYERGLVTFLEEGCKPVKSHEISMEGLRLDNIRNNLFILPSDSLPGIGYFDFTTLAYSILNDQKTFLDRNTVSLTEISQLNTGTISFIHKYMGFLPWYGNNYLYYGVRLDKSADPGNMRAMFIQKIAIR